MLFFGAEKRERERRAQKSCKLFAVGFFLLSFFSHTRLSSSTSNKKNSLLSSTSGPWEPMCSPRASMSRCGGGLFSRSRLLFGPAFSILSFLSHLSFSLFFPIFVFPLFFCLFHTAYPRLRHAHGGEFIFLSLGERAREQIERGKKNRLSHTLFLSHSKNKISKKNSGKLPAAGRRRRARRPDANEHRRPEQPRLGLRLRARGGARGHVGGKREERETKIECRKKKKEKRRGRRKKRAPRKRRRKKGRGGSNVGRCRSRASRPSPTSQTVGPAPKRARAEACFGIGTVESSFPRPTSRTLGDSRYSRR